MIDYMSQYQSVCKAIAEIEGGAQSYQIGNRQVTKANIMHLYKERDSLAKALARNSDNTYIAMFDGR